MSVLLLLEENKGTWSKNRSCKRSKRRHHVPNTPIPDELKVGSLTMTGRVWQEDMMTGETDGQVGWQTTGTNRLEDAFTLKAWLYCLDVIFFCPDSLNSCLKWPTKNINVNINMSWTCIFSNTWYTCRTINHGTQLNMVKYGYIFYILYSIYIYYILIYISIFNTLHNRRKNPICATSKNLIWSTFAIVYIRAWWHQYTKMKTHESTPGTYMHKHTPTPTEADIVHVKQVTEHSHTDTPSYNRLLTCRGLTDLLCLWVKKTTMWRQIRDWSDRQLDFITF